jgi:hypothetical protein
MLFDEVTRDGNVCYKANNANEVMGSLPHMSCGHC